MTIIKKNQKPTKKKMTTQNIQISQFHNLLNRHQFGATHLFNIILQHSEENELIAALNKAHHEEYEINRRRINKENHHKRIALRRKQVADKKRREHQLQHNIIMMEEQQYIQQLNH